MIIRILLLSALAAIGYMVFLRRSRFPVHIVIVFLMLAVAGLAVIFPEKTDVVSGWFGIGRGVDLINYLVLMALLYTVTHYYTKFVDIEQQLTQLVREIAILRAEVRQARGESLAAPPSPAALASADARADDRAEDAEDRVKRQRGEIEQ
jgi:small membrane protein